VLEELKGQDLIVTYTNRWLKRGDFPNIICVGPPGCGKTTWEKIFVSMFFAENGKPWNIWEHEHPDYFRLNASDERGIDVVRGKIKKFVESLPARAPLRIMVMEEGDKLTRDAEDALRAIIEDNQDTCRFIFLGNNKPRVAAVLSRCATLRFHALPDDAAMNYFRAIAAKYDVEIPEDIAMVIAEFYEGDMRKMINDCLEKLVGIDHPVGMDDLDFTSDVKYVATQTMALLVGDDPKKAYMEARKYFTKQHGKLRFNLRQFVGILHEMVGGMAFELADEFAVTDMNLADGGLKEIQVGALLVRMAQCLNKNK
jgi:replication factor C small subunit